MLNKVCTIRDKAFWMFLFNFLWTLHGLTLDWICRNGHLERGTNMLSTYIYTNLTVEWWAQNGYTPFSHHSNNDRLLLMSWRTVWEHYWHWANTQLNTPETERNRQTFCFYRGLISLWFSLELNRALGLCCFVDCGFVGQNQASSNLDFVLNAYIHMISLS